MKRYAGLIFVLLLSAGICCGCDDLIPSDDLPVVINPTTSQTESSMMQSSIESAEEESSEQSQAASSETEESKAESSAQSSAEPSLSEADNARTELKAYADKMEKSGQERFSRYASIDGNEYYTWKVKQYIIDDFNHDGEPELVIQYATCPMEGWDEQGIVLEIVQYKEGDYLVYRTADSFEKYVRIAGSGYMKHEMVDELYIDEDNHLCILSTRLSGTSPISICYQTYTCDNGSMSVTSSVRVTPERYEPSGKYDVASTSFAMVNNESYVYRFSYVGADDIPKPLDRATALTLHQNMLDIQPAVDFAVPDAVVHLSEKEDYYYTPGITFCERDELE